jgi:hypothetical protein
MRSLDFDRIKVKNIFENKSLIEECRTSQMSATHNMTESTFKSGSRAYSTLVSFK